MWGSIIGDFAGSIYEYDQVKKGVHPVEIDEIVEDCSFFTDDTIMTAAVADAILHGDDQYMNYYKKYVEMFKDYDPKFAPYFKSAFSPNFLKILKGEAEGNSKGNGALMRISPVGYMFDKPSLVDTQAIWATGVTHNSPEAINSARIVALMIYYFRKGLTKEEVIAALCSNASKHPGIDFEEPSYQPFEKFNGTCSETLNNVLYAVLNSDSYEEVIRKVISYGGDTDTNACIAGGIAEAAYGVPEKLVEKVKVKVPTKISNVISNCYLDKYNNGQVIHKDGKIFSRIF